MDGFYCFRYYHSVRNHFKKKNFNILSYGHTSKNLSVRVFENDQCRPLYERLSELYRKEDYEWLCRINLFLNPDIWVDHLLSEHAYNSLLWQKRYLLRPDYFLVEEFRQMKNSYGKISNFDIWRELINTRIHPDTVVHLCRMFPAFYDKIERESDHIVRQGISFRLKKFSAFVVVPDVSYYENAKKKMFELCVEPA